MASMNRLLAGQHLSLTQCGPNFADKFNYVDSWTFPSTVMVMPAWIFSVWALPCTSMSCKGAKNASCRIFRRVHCIKRAHPSEVCEIESNRQRLLPYSIRIEIVALFTHTQQTPMIWRLTCFARQCCALKLSVDETFLYGANSALFCYAFGRPFMSAENLN